MSVPEVSCRLSFFYWLKWDKLEKHFVVHRSFLEWLWWLVHPKKTSCSDALWDDTYIPSVETNSTDGSPSNNSQPIRIFRKIFDNKFHLLSCPSVVISCPSVDSALQYNLVILLFKASFKELKGFYFLIPCSW